MASPLELERTGDGELHFIAESGRVHAHAKVAALDRTARIESHGVRLVDRVHSRTDQMRMQNDRFGHTMERQVAGDRPFTLRRELHLRRSKGGLWKLRRVEPLVAFQLFRENRNGRLNRL